MAASFHSAFTRALVWFKRDLRCEDHAPLALAAQCDAALALFILEDEWLASPECDAQHVAFTLACLASLKQSLAQRGLQLLVMRGTCLEVLSQVRAQFPFTHVLSHEAWPIGANIIKWIGKSCRKRALCDG
jgi:deoxyribodipyrimidine photo-lyase